MITLRGWLVVATAPLLLFAGRLFALRELYVLAVTGAVLVLASVVYVRSAVPSVRVDRAIHPRRVHAGNASRADLTLVNAGRRTTPTMVVRDSFDRGARAARFLAAPLRPASSARAAYRLPTDARGIYDVGPLTVTVSDPLGLAAATRVVTPPTQLTVLPHVDRIRPLPRTLGDDPHAGADHPTSLSGGGDDFYALRPYVHGDDLRRVHWPSTARLDELMIRQDELPWQSRATIFVDVRRQVHTPASLELAVSAGASVLEASRRHGALVRLVTTDGTDSGFASGQAHADAVLEHLAAVEASRLDRLALAASALRKSGNGGAVAVVTTAEASDSDLDAIAALTAAHGHVVLVLFERSSFDSSRRAGHLGPRRTPSVHTLVRVTASEPFATAWDRALARSRSAARR